MVFDKYYYISHRGNLYGPLTHRENTTEYIQEAIDAGYDVEIDLWFFDTKLYLGHDSPQYEVTFSWLYKRRDKLWIHLKNSDAVRFMKEHTRDFNYFVHEDEPHTITSKGFSWAHYNTDIPPFASILVCPEKNLNMSHITSIGICSDYVGLYAEKKQ